MTNQNSGATSRNFTVVAIDGPAGSGKSSVSKEVSRQLGFAYLDTGAAYRALAWYALDQELDLDDASALAGAAASFAYRISLDADHHWVSVGERDVTTQIRQPRVADAVSAVARIPAVRECVTALFRRLIASVTDAPGIVVEGRDITTVVAPDAPVRILLTASPDVRALRRSAEVTTQDAASVAASLHRRDAADSRVTDFLTAAEGVVVVDSTDLDFDATVGAVREVVRTLSGEHHGH